jgi:hypothetical protein
MKYLLLALLLAPVYCAAQSDTMTSAPANQYYEQPSPPSPPAYRSKFDSVWEAGIPEHNTVVPAFDMETLATKDDIDRVINDTEENRYMLESYIDDKFLVFGIIVGGINALIGAIVITLLIRKMKTKP